MIAVKNKNYMPRSDALDLKYSKSILKYLLKFGKVNKSSLFKIVSNNLVLDKLLNNLWIDGYIEINKNNIGPIIYKISLTYKGIYVAKFLCNLDSFIDSFEKNDNESTGIFINDNIALNPYSSNFDIINPKVAPAIHDNIISIDVGSKIISVEIKTVNKMYIKLWCHEDKTFKCAHTAYLWNSDNIQNYLQDFAVKFRLKSILGHSL